MDKLAEAAESNLDMLNEQPDGTTPTPAEGEQVKAGPDGAEKTTPDANTVLAELKGRIERGEIKLEDLPPELLPADARKVQSSFAKKYARVERAAERAAEALSATGVNPPAGKTMMDLLTEDDGKGFSDLMRAQMDAAVRPIKQMVDADQLMRDVKSSLDLTIQRYPDLKPLLPQIGQVIEQNEQLAAWAANTDAIPYLVAGVGRDLQYQDAKNKLETVQTENKRLKEILKTANIAINNGKETSRAGGRTPNAAGDGSPKPKGFDAIASAVYDRIASNTRAN